MASNDWESLMNGVFGQGGGRLRLNENAPKEKARQRTEKSAPQIPTAQDLKKMQKTLDAQLKQQAEEIAQLSGELTQAMQDDGLLTKAQAAVPAPCTKAAKDSVQEFAQLPALLEETVLGQPEYIKQLVLAFKRPFVLGTQDKAARNVILIHGPKGTGRHLTLRTLAKKMEDKGLLANSEIVWMDLGLYPGPAQEKLFLQDLYAALCGSGQIVVFERYEECSPGFLETLAALVKTGRAPLNSRYVVQKGMLVDAGTALVPQAVSSLTPEGKYLVFLSEKGPEKLADKLGAGVVSALGDICCTHPFEEQSITAIAAKGLNQLAQNAKNRLQLTVSADAAVRDLAAGMANSGCGAAPVTEFCERCLKALSEYKLQNDPAPGTTAGLSVEGNRVMAAFDGEEKQDLFALLRGEYTGALDEVNRELESIVGLDEVKDYVLRLKDNVQVQQRRAQAGMRTAALSMHMIFAGNPGTGKTTIARLVGKYLKAIGALSGGQLVEVTRADLVGRYVGHTAPLTNQVIRSALGGVLFIDEAYSLYRGKDDSFGLEAIDTLVKGMEDHREDLVVILAGYSKEMEQFLTANSGLASRFPNQIEFPDYTGEELWKITQINARSKGYRLGEGCEEALTAYYTKRQQEDARTAGNGRLARNKLEEAILNQSRRLVAQPEAALDELLVGDFELEET